MLLTSYIIPVYNAATTIGRCLDSIYSQGLDPETFEVICVDDCSQDPGSIKAIEKYLYKGIHPQNLTLLKHNVNKRQGAARNTGVKAARGEWIQFIDADDFFVAGALTRLSSVLAQHPDADMVAFDYIVCNEDTVISRDHRKSNSTQIMSGLEYHLKQIVPSMPTELCYKRALLLSNKVFFVEMIRFEDLDFILKVLLLAKKVLFAPVDVFCHIEHPGQTTDIGADKIKIHELLQMGNRVAYLALDVAEEHKENSKLLMAHAGACKTTFVKRDVWKLPFKERLDVLLSTRLPFKTGNKSADFISKHPFVACAALSFLNKTIVSMAIRAKAVIKKLFIHK